MHNLIASFDLRLTMSCDITFAKCTHWSYFAEVIYA